MGQRKDYIDNLRLLCVLLLIPYHTAMAWNCWGENNFIIIEPDKIISSLIVFVSPWYMTLMFLLAGISARYSLITRTKRDFINERIRKLVIPFFIGILTVMPVLAYVGDKSNNGYSGGFLEHYVVFFTKWTDLTSYDGGFGVGHLWFLIFLFVVSLFALLIIDISNKTKVSLSNKNILLIICFLIFTFSLQKIELASKSIVTYLLLFLIGYFFFSDDDLIAKIASKGMFFVPVWFLFSIINVYLFIWSGKDFGIANSIMSQLSGVFGILALISIGKVFMDKSNDLVRRLCKKSFLIYIVHFPVVVVLQYVLLKRISNSYILFMVTTLISYCIIAIVFERLPYLYLKLKDKS